MHGTTGVHQNCLLSEMIFFYLVENAVGFLTFESCIKISFLALCIGVVSFYYFLAFLILQCRSVKKYGHKYYKGIS